MQHKTWLDSSFLVTCSLVSLVRGCMDFMLAPGHYASISGGAKYYSTLLTKLACPKAHVGRKILLVLKGVYFHLLHFCLDGETS